MAYRAFVSSTFIDLKGHRRHVIDALRKAGFTVDPMEEWTADADEPRAFSQERVTGCDLCILLVARRRGHVPSGETLSITQMEYLAAVKEHIDVLPFVLDPAAPWYSDFDQTSTDPELSRWRAELLERHGAGKFGLDPQTIDIAPALTRWLARRGTTPRKAAGSELSCEWLRQHAERLEREFAARMASGPQTEVADAKKRYVELLLTIGGDETTAPVDRPFREALESPGTRYLVTAVGGSGKSTSILRVAAEAARRACEDPHAPVPLYARLSFFDAEDRGFERLTELLAGSTLTRDTVAGLWREGARPLMLLLDGFNEIAGREAKRACLRGIQELLQAPAHTVVVASRPDMVLDPLVRAGGPMKPAQVVELDDDRVREFLARHGAAELYDRLTTQLRQLGKNPFMLWALAQSCSNLPQGHLPSNQGELYVNFIERYIFGQREEPGTAASRYNYKLVKRPVLTRLALRMTRGGEKRLAHNTALLRDIGAHLQEIRREHEGLEELEPYAFMPDPPAARALIDELLQNGVLRRVDQSLEFMHESVQDCFSAMALQGLPVASIVSEVPEAQWVEGKDRPANSRATALRDTLIMLAGLLPSGSELVAGLATKDMTLAAACFAASVAVEEEVRDQLIDRCLQLMRSDDAIEQYVGCESIRAARLQTPEILAAVERLASSAAPGVALAAVSAASHFPLTEQTNIAIEALALSGSSTARMLAAAVLAPNDMLLITGLSLIGRDDGGDGGRSEQAGPADILLKVRELHRSHRATPELVQLASSADPHAALILMRLTRRAEARQLLLELAGDPDKRFLAPVHLAIVCGSDACEKLLEMLTDSALQPEMGSTIGFALASVMAQCRIFSKSVAERIGSNIRAWIETPTAGIAQRVAAAVALLHAGDDSDFRNVMDRLADPAELHDFKVPIAVLGYRTAVLPGWLLNLNFWYTRSRLWADFVFDRVLREPDHKLRVLYVRQLAEDANAKNKLLERLRDANEDPAVRSAAAFAAAQLNDRRAVPELMEIISRGADDQLRGIAVGMLVQMMDDEVRASLTRMALEDAEERARHAAVSALSVAGHKAATRAAVSWCLDAALSAEQGMRGLDALRLLSTMEPVELENFIRIALDAPHEVVRLSGAAVAYGQDNAAAVAALRAVLTDVSAPAEKREAATCGLAWVAVSALEELTADGSEPSASGWARFGKWFGEELTKEKQFPSSGARIVYRALSHAQAANWQHALDYSTELIGLLPDDALGYHLRSASKHALGDLEGALQDAEKRVQLKPDDATSWAHVAELNGLLSRDEDAYQAYRNAARLAPDNAGYWSSVGWHGYVSGHLEESIEGSRRSIAAGETAPMAWFNLGLALLASGEEKAAAPEYAAGLQACRALDEAAARENIQGALGDLVALQQRRPDLTTAITAINQTLQAASTAHA